MLPQSFGIYKRVQFEVRNSIPTVMLQDNVFIDVVDGMTMLIGEKFDDGLARDLFIHDERTEGKVITMTARVGRFVERDGLPAVILQDGERIELTKTGDSGATLLFDTHTVTIAPKDKTVSSQMPIDMNEDTISNLLNPDKSPYPDYFNQRRAEGTLQNCLTRSGACSDADSNCRRPIRAGAAPYLVETDAADDCRKHHRHFGAYFIEIACHEHAFNRAVALCKCHWCRRSFCLPC